MFSNPLGSYAVTTQDQMSWLTGGSNNSWDAKPKAAPKKSRYKTAPKTLVYKSLKEGAKFINDPEWKEIVENAAYGDFPAGFSTRREGIVYSYSDKKASINPSTDPYEAVFQTINFMRMVGGIKTKLDLENAREEFDQMVQQAEKDFNNQTWKDLKAKAKKFAISNFVDRLARSYHLSDDDRKLVHTLIFLGLNNGMIQTGDIDYRSGMVQSINGLVYDQSSQHFKLRDDLFSKVKTKAFKGSYPDYIYFSLHRQPIKNKKFKGFAEEWEKYKRDCRRQKMKAAGTNTFTRRETERAMISPYSLEYGEVQDSIDDRREDISTDNSIDLRIEPEAVCSESRINPDNLLLSPRVELPLKFPAIDEPHNLSTFDRPDTPPVILIIS